MALLKLLLILSFFSLPSFAREMEEDGDEALGNPSLLMQINRERYTDFFERRKDQEKEQARIDAGIPEVKEERMKDAREQAQALEEYLRHRKPLTEDPRLEEQWNLEQKAQKEQLEVWRKRYVQQRDEIKAVEKRSQQIPEKKEYDLEED